jgi:transcriptional regulator with XRE-family HTH domain
MKVTKFGQFIRTLRIERGVNLKEMSEALKVTSAHLSALELGKKNIPKKIIQQVKDYFSLTTEQEKILETLVLESQAVIKLDLRKDDSVERELAYRFARTYKNLDPEKKQKLKDILGD